MLKSPSLATDMGPGSVSMATGANASTDVVSKRLTQSMAGIAAILLVVAGGVLYLLNNSIQSATKEEADKAAQVGSAQQVAEKYQATLTDYNATCSQLQFVEKSIAPNAYIPTLVPQIEHLAQSYDLNVSAIRPGPVSAAPAPAASTDPSAPAAPPYQTMSLGLTLSGSYTQIMKFMYSLTKFPKIITVKSLSLSPAGSAPTVNGKPQTNLSANIAMAAYVFVPDPNDALPVATTTPPAPDSFSEVHKQQQDLLNDSINRPIAAAQTVQSDSQQRVNSSGFQSQPGPAVPQTTLGKGAH